MHALFFEKIENKDVILWSAIISGYARSEIFDEALALY